MSSKLNIDLLNRDSLVNLGIKECFEIFMDNKAEFVEGILKLKLWSTTIKEILDLIEKKLNPVLNNSNFDETKIYTAKSYQNSSPKPLKTV